MSFDVLYRAYFAARNFGAIKLRRWPRVRRTIKRLFGIVPPDTQVWVQVQSGLSRGMWMRLHLPRETRLWRGQHELAVQAALVAAVRPGTVVYEIGAHSGILALGTARLVGPQGCVVAFEADFQIAENLKENVLRNALAESVQIVPSAVWSHTATDVPFRRGRAEGMHGGVESDGQHPVLAGGEVIDVSAVTLDDFIANGGLIPQLVKIDVEGGEYEVLQGGAKLFANQRPLLIAEVHHPKAAEHFGKWLTEYRYGARWIVPSEGFPRILFAWPQEHDGADWMRRSNTGITN